MTRTPDEAPAAARMVTRMKQDPTNPDPKLTPAAGASGRPLQLVLQKRDQSWVFRYQPGHESQVLKSIAAAAADPTRDFDWFDAAVLCHQMGDTMHEQLRQLMTPKT